MQVNGLFTKQEMPKQDIAQQNILQNRTPKSINTRKTVKIAMSCLALIALYFGLLKYKNDTAEIAQTLAIVSNPKVNDIYFLDYRHLSDKLRPNEKYRIAKVVDITGDIVTLVYGQFLYQYQNAAVNSIQYGQLSYKDYFEPKRYNLSLASINSMVESNTIYLAKRPIRDKLFGNLVGPEKAPESSSQLIYGKKENTKGEAFLNDKFSETSLVKAFDFFQESANLGYVKGQVNLAEMYINGQHVEQNLTQALSWLKQAALQSHKPAILKYGIVCEQVPSCDVVNFYQELTHAGVNIKVRKLDFELSH